MDNGGGFVCIYLSLCLVVCARFHVVTKANDSLARALESALMRLGGCAVMFV